MRPVPKFKFFNKTVSFKQHDTKNSFPHFCSFSFVSFKNALKKLFSQKIEDFLLEKKSCLKRTHPNVHYASN